VVRAIRHRLALLHVTGTPRRRNHKLLEGFHSSATALGIDRETQRTTINVLCDSKDDDVNEILLATELTLVVISYRCAVFVCELVHDRVQTILIGGELGKIERHCWEGT